MNRKPNAGPYIVSWEDLGIRREAEYHLWLDACFQMRKLLIANYKNVSVRFV